MSNARENGRPPALAPMLSVKNGKKAVEFYKQAFGAEELFRIENDAGEIVARLSFLESEFWVADESPMHKNFSPQTIGGGTIRILMMVDDPDSAVDRATSAGARIVSPVRDQHGWRGGRIEDPFGHHWEIAKELGRDGRS